LLNFCYLVLSWS